MNINEDNICILCFYSLYIFTLLLSLILVMSWPSSCDVNVHLYGIVSQTFPIALDSIIVVKACAE